MTYSWIATSSYNTAYSAPRQARDEFILSEVEGSSQRRSGDASSAFIPEYFYIIPT